MSDTKVNSRHWACWVTNSGSLAWLLRCRGQSAAVSNASYMRAFVPKPQCDPSLLPPFWSCCKLTLPALRQWWIGSTPKCSAPFGLLWPFCKTHHGHMWPLIRLQKLLLSFCGKAMSWSSKHQPSSWVTKRPTLKATSSDSFVRIWAYGRLGLHLIMLKPMDR